MEGNNKIRYTFADYRHIIRMAIILIVGFSVFIVLRYMLVPKTYYEKGRYRAAAVDNVASSPKRFAGQDACAGCHDDKDQSLLSSKHKTLHCETCHWASNEHAEDPGIEPRRKVKVQGMREFCLTCHDRQIGRPVSFPQIEDDNHNPGDHCSKCHNPHKPEAGE